MTTEDKILFNYQKCLSEALETSKLEKQNRDHALLKLLKVTIYEYKRWRYVIHMYFPVNSILYQQIHIWNCIITLDNASKKFMYLIFVFANWNSALETETLSCSCSLKLTNILSY